jgi:SAM-dependent methyltransferase
MTLKLEDETLRVLVRCLRVGAHVSDVDFDLVFPEWARALSDIHWTPVDVARRAARLLSLNSGTRVLDIGAGVGKFCLIGALTTRATFVGIEQRESLVRAARHTAGRLDAARAQFVHGNMEDLDWSEFDAFYLFNPFYEHIACALSCIETDSISLIPEYYKYYAELTCEKLSAAPSGTRVVLYSGFGANLPKEYRLVLHEPAGSNYLELYVKEPLAPVFRDGPEEQSDASDRRTQPSLRVLAAIGRSSTSRNGRGRRE